MKTVAEDTAVNQRKEATLHFKREAKKIAIQSAGNIRSYATNILGQQIPIQPEITAEAEKIYQWLIKDTI